MAEKMVAQEKIEWHRRDDADEIIVVRDARGHALPPMVILPGDRIPDDFPASDLAELSKYGAIVAEADYVAEPRWAR